MMFPRTKQYFQFIACPANLRASVGFTCTPDRNITISVVNYLYIFASE
jgi:hypothetical protein